MTGRELILYILNNGLENEQVFKNGKFIGFMKPDEVALASNVGLATVYAWIHQGRIESEAVSAGIYVPANFKVVSNIACG
jgi:transposase